MPKLFVGNRVLDCGVVIFDKDGTLVDYQAVDLELAKARKNSIESLLGKDVANL
jgi:phosphoglycolate phosphatase-like HAD superfamily hydrolase